MRATDGHAFASDFKSWVRERSVQLGALALRRLVADARPSSTAQVLWISLHYEARPRAFTVREFVAMSVHEAQMLLGNTAPDLRAILEEPIHGARAAGRRHWSVIIAECAARGNRLRRIIPQSWAPGAEMSLCSRGSLASLPLARCIAAALAWQAADRRLQSARSEIPVRTTGNDGDDVVVQRAPLQGA